MTTKQLTKVGNSLAIIIDKNILKNSGLGEDTLFEITSLPHNGLIIQSVKPTNINLAQASFRKVMAKNEQLIRNLADR